MIGRIFDVSSEFASVTVGILNSSKDVMTQGLAGPRPRRPSGESIFGRFFDKKAVSHR
jgi:hypothetical protein